MATLARLSFWVPPEQMADFDAAYEKQVAPSLAEHGLAASSEVAVHGFEEKTRQNDRSFA